MRFSKGANLKNDKKTSPIPKFPATMNYHTSPRAQNDPVLDY